MNGIYFVFFVLLPREFYTLAGISLEIVGIFVGFGGRKEEIWQQRR